MEQKIQAAVVGDQPLSRIGIVQTLAAQRDIVIAAQGSTIGDAVRIAKETTPHVLVLDLNLQDAGTATVETIAAHHPGVNVLILSLFAHKENIVAAMRRGARGYVLKDVSCAELIDSVRALGRGERYLAQGLTAQLLTSLQGEAAQGTLAFDRFSMLTLREQQVLALVTQALSNKEIALRTDLTEKTVKHYLTSILKKLQVRNRVEAALLASHRNPEISADVSEQEATRSQQVGFGRRLAAVR